MGGVLIAFLLLVVLIHFKYKSTRAVAIALVDRGEEPFGIERSKWRYYPFIWELIMFASSMRCFNFKNDCCCNKSDGTLTQTQSDVEEPNENISLTGAAAPDFLVATLELLPSEEWKDSLKDIVENFKKMIAKCENISFESFKSNFQKYANHQNSHSSHCRHHGCGFDGHSQYIRCFGFESPVLYYAWLDWNSFRKYIQGRDGK